MYIMAQKFSSPSPNNGTRAITTESALSKMVCKISFTHTRLSEMFLYLFFTGGKWQEVIKAIFKNKTRCQAQEPKYSKVM